MFFLYSLEYVSMDCNQNSNPLDFSQSGKAFKEVNNIVVTKKLKSNEPTGSQSNIINQVTIYCFY